VQGTVGYCQCTVMTLFTVCTCIAVQCMVRWIALLSLGGGGACMVEFMLPIEEVLSNYAVHTPPCSLVKLT
jgi:hypothetical protein